MHPAVGALIARLREMRAVVASLDGDEYAASGVPGVTASIGGHVRHCLDHIEALERARATGRVDYDQRVRGTRVETNVEEAVTAIERACARLQTWPAVLAEPVEFTGQVAVASRPVAAGSTLDREVAFVLNHTIHHSAVVALLANRIGHAVPPRFGFAPATPVDARA